MHCHLDKMVDFSKARLDDPKWWTMLLVVVDEVRRRLRLRWLDWSQQRTLAKLSSSEFSPKTLKETIDESLQNLSAAYNLLFPWESKEKDEPNQELIGEIAEWKRLWSEAFGIDPDTPEGQRLIEEAANAIHDPDYSKQENAEKARMEGIAARVRARQEQAAERAKHRREAMFNLKQRRR